MDQMTEVTDDNEGLEFEIVNSATLKKGISSKASKYPTINEEDTLTNKSGTGSY